MDHISDNLNILDFQLTDEEMTRIAELDKNERYYHGQMSSWSSLRDGNRILKRRETNSTVLLKQNGAGGKRIALRLLNK